MKKEFIEGKHYYIDGDRVVFTALYHLERGYCCNKNCRHCPYKQNKNQENMEIKIKPLYPEVKLPISATEYAACYDVHAHSIKTHLSDPYKIVVGLGFATEIPQGYKGIIVPRSNITRYNWVLNNSFGVIDADYRGEWMAVFTIINHLGVNPITLMREFPYSVGDRIAQIYFDKVTPVTFTTVTELQNSNRGEGGFGSTGVK